MKRTDQVFQDIKKQNLVNGEKCMSNHMQVLFSIPNVFFFKFCHMHEIDTLLILWFFFETKETRWNMDG